MQYLIVDVETYSEADIRSVGAYRYISDPSFELLMTGYALDDADPVCEEGMPSEDFCEMLYDPNVIKVAHNAPFEREVFHRVFGRVCPPEEWLDTMALAAYCGLPLSLAAVCRALGFAEDKQKDTRGKRLIQYFSKPCKPTKKNGGRTRNLPEHDPTLWQEYKEYNLQDVVSEREVLRTLIRYAPPEDEQKMWCLDQRINDRGVRIDRAFAVAASEMGENYKTEKLEEARLLTGIDNPSSVAQVKAYIKDTEGIEVESLNKKSIPDVMVQLDTEEAQELMHLREEFSKSANKKYDAMLRSLCPDDHVRGCFQYGGTHTLRWAGRLVQMQNMKQNHLPDLDAARTLVRTGDTEAVELLYGSVSDVLGQLTRTALIPEDGCRFVVSDFSAIEARVVSWMAGETWVTEAFRQGKDIYCEVASQMFGVPVAKHGPNAELRQKGKIALLACIAEGQPVLTDRGLVPIEQITTDMRVWDGVTFVEHEGVIYKGEREVITYDGLTATPDHVVWCEGKSKPIPLGDAAASGARLLRSGCGRHPIWMGEGHIPGEEMERVVEQVLRSDGMHGMRLQGLDDSRKPDARHIQRLSSVYSDETDTPLAGSASNGREAEMRKPERCPIRRLRWAWNKVLLPICNGCWAMYIRQSWATRSVSGDGSDRHERKLRTGKFTLYKPQAEQRESKVYRFVRVRPQILALFTRYGRENVGVWPDKGSDYRSSTKGSRREAQGVAGDRRTVRVYDIRNAGPRHRFTVSGVLVHNCGYGGGVNALKAFGADKMGMSEELQQEIVDKWRASNPHIVSYWKRVERAAISAVVGHSTTALGDLTFKYERGTLWVHLPSGRAMAYHGAQYAESSRRQGKTLSYMGVDQQTRRWVRVETFGGRLVENLVQAVARDILRDKMLALDAAGFDIRGHVHDEVILSVPREITDAKEQVSRIMGEELPWTAGLPLNAESYECDYYQKD